MIGMKVTGIGSVRTQLTNIARKVPDGSRKLMYRKANEIVKLAKIMVPEDTGALMDSIRIERGYEAPGGRLFINVVVGDRVVVLANGREVDLNQYALIIHETYGSMNPGPKTQIKQAQNPGVLVGERFMTRAAEKVRPTVNADMYRMIDSIILGETR